MSKTIPKQKPSSSKLSSLRRGMLLLAVAVGVLPFAVRGDEASQAPGEDRGGYVPPIRDPATSLAAAGTRYVPPAVAAPTGLIGLLPGEDIYAHIPDRGKPTDIVAGGTRWARGLRSLEALIPQDHIGITTRSQPTLYWYLTEDTSIPIDFSIGGRTDPNIQIRPLQGPFKAGIQRIRLSDYNIELKEGVPYRWSVALIPNPKKRSNDVVCSGLLEYQEPSEELTKALAAADEAQRPGIYGQRGVWYEAFGLLSDQIAASPDSAFLRDQRANLIEQIGFPKIAAAERAAP